jgi:formamidopyrimidine-DNA glycosylase
VRLLANAQVSKLGPDPLRPSDDAERFWARVSSSRKPIGLLLMDQSAIAGTCGLFIARFGEICHLWCVRLYGTCFGNISAMQRYFLKFLAHV